MGWTIAIGRSSGRVEVWNVGKESPIFSSKSRIRPSTYLAFSSNGKVLAAGYASGRIELWNAATLTVLGTVQGSKPEHAVAFSPDGRTLAAGDSDGTIARWSVITGHPLGARLTTGGSAVHGIAFSAGGRALAAGDAAGGIDLWDETGQLTAAYPGSGSSVSSVAFRPDAATLMAGTTGHLLLFDYSPSLAGPGTMPLSRAALGSPVSEVQAFRAVASMSSLETQRATFSG